MNSYELAIALYKHLSSPTCTEEELLSLIHQEADLEVLIQVSEPINTFKSLLEIAIEKGNIPAIKLFIAYGSDPYRNKILLTLVKNKQEEMALSIIQHPKFTFREDALLILLVALDTRQITIAQALLNKYTKNIVHPDAAILNGRTALEIAQEGAYFEVANQLRRHGAKVNQMPASLRSEGLKSSTDLLWEALDKKVDESVGIWLVEKGAKLTLHRDRCPLETVIVNKQLRLGAAILKKMQEKSMLVDNPIVVSNQIIATNDIWLMLDMYQLIPVDLRPWFCMQVQFSLGEEMMSSLFPGRHREATKNMVLLSEYADMLLWKEAKDSPDLTFKRVDEVERGPVLSCHITF